MKHIYSLIMALGFSFAAQAETNRESYSLSLGFICFDQPQRECRDFPTHCTIYSLKVLDFSGRGAAVYTAVTGILDGPIVLTQDYLFDGLNFVDASSTGVVLYDCEVEHIADAQPGAGIAN